MGTIGVDFDNTIVCYHEICHRLALDSGLIPATVAVSKTAVRDDLRARGAEAEWTALQGILYGPRLRDAEPFPGVLEFFQACHRFGIACRIISHKTKYPSQGEPHDLHQAALEWLRDKGFFSPATGLSLDSVFLESTRLAKMQRIAAEGCVMYIDDLPECLTDPAFPAGVERILFDCTGSLPLGSYFRCESWHQIAAFVLGALERRST